MQISPGGVTVAQQAIDVRRAFPRAQRRGAALAMERIQRVQGGARRMPGNVAEEVRPPGRSRPGVVCQRGGPLRVGEEVLEHGKEGVPGGGGEDQGL